MANQQPQQQPQPSTSKKSVPAFVSRDFQPCDWPPENDCFGSLGASIANVNTQEQLLLRDLLYVLIGMEARYIRLRRSGDDSVQYKLELDPTTDQHLAVITKKILKISSCYSATVRFVESDVYGLVNQALVAAIHRHLLEYNMLVASMEEQLMRHELFLQKMFYQLLPYISTFNLLRDLAINLYRNKYVGGDVLTVLHEKTKSIQGMDNKALELCLTLTKCASMPYFDILKTWIYCGEIRDPRGEFFIEDTQHTTSHQASSSDDEYDFYHDDDYSKFNDKYWDQRYRINSSNTPIFLKKYEQMIYKTGKYISIINKVKTLFMERSRVPSRPPQSSFLSSFGAFSALQQNDRPNGSHHQFSGPSSDFGTSVSNYSLLNDLLRGVASMQMIGGGATSGVPPFPFSILSDLSLAGGMSSSSTSSSNSALSGGSAGNAPTATEQANTASAAAVAAANFTPKPEEILYSLDDSTYIAPIIAAYEEASSQLLHILVNESQLVETFNAVKHYMLLSMGDFIVNFMKFAAKDLGKRTSSVVQHRLDSMMGMALGISVAAGDRALLKDDPHVEFAGESFLNQIIKINNNNSESNLQPIGGATGFPPSLAAAASAASIGKRQNNNKQTKLYCYESLMLRFEVPFPLSLIFTPKSIVCYQLLFRYVFMCRYAEMELEETWKDNILNVQLRKADSLERKAMYSMHKKAFALRYKMIAFVRNFHYFYAFEVIDPFFAQFISQITRRGSSLDSVIEYHEKFLEHCFSSCFLTSLEITSIIIKIFMLCIELSHALKGSIDPDSRAAANPYSTGRKPRDSSDGPSGARAGSGAGSSGSGTSGGSRLSLSGVFESQLHEKLNKSYLANRHFGKSVGNVKEVVERANSEFDALVTKLLKKIYSDYCEYHMMYPFVARLDFNDFYRSKIID